MSCEVKTILYATDLEPESAKACELVMHLAATLGTRVHVVHVIEPTFPQSGVLNLSLHADSELADEVYEKIRTRLAHMRDVWGRPGALEVPLDQIRVLIGVTTDTILLEAESVGADMLVLGTHQRGVLGQLLHGSVAKAILTKTPIPVLVVPLGDHTENHPRAPREKTP